jgi:NAD(P)-dependent dehydrogenase (short-subunit alcohol dehydrogenase family)
VTQGALIVTGASRGIGAAIAMSAAAQGYSVAVNFAKDSRAAEGVVDQIVSAGGDAIQIQADVSREHDVLRMFAAAERKFGAIHALVNNAGVTGGFARVEALTIEAIRAVLDVNVVGTMLCAREGVKRMSTKLGGAGGSIVNVSTIAARLGGSGEWVHYAASKGAVDTFTIGLAREVASEGIRVNAVAPGLVETEIHLRSGDPDRPRRMAPSIPMGRAGTAEEVAAAILWLLSPSASYVTGTILEVGGGR